MEEQKLINENCLVYGMSFITDPFFRCLIMKCLYMPLKDEKSEDGTLVLLKVIF